MSLRGGGYGVNGEALTRLWHAAQAEPRLSSLQTQLGERAQCVAGLAVDAQSRTGSSKVRGAWFRDGETRMDDQQHAMSAILGTIPIAAADDHAGSGRTAPSTWLWLLALLAAFNPFRIALSLPRPRNTVVAGLGGVAGGVVAVGLALAADGVLDLLDVSRPALRIAAGLVAAVTAIVGIVRRPGDDTGAALPGLWAAVVPVAVPLVVSPALVVLALSAGADRGVAPVAIAAAIGTGILAALATQSTTLYAWASRVSAAILLVASVLLVVNGVLDV